MAQLFPSLEQIRKLKVVPEAGELRLLEFLQDNLSNEFEVYFQPFLNGDRPDIIVMRRKGGVMIIEVKDWCLDRYFIDEHGEWRLKSNEQLIKSPVRQVLSYKKNLYNLHIDELLRAQVENPKVWAVVSCGVYFNRATTVEIDEFMGTNDEKLIGDLGGQSQPFGDVKQASFFSTASPKHIPIYQFTKLGRDSLTPKYFNKLMDKLGLNGRSCYFSDELYDSFKRYLQPAHHTIEQIEQIKYTKKQEKLTYSKPGEQKIIGVAGSGKTMVLAKRAVNAHVRTRNKVLILTYNVTMRNYIHDQISKVRENFCWGHFHINHYHQLFRATANNHNLLITNFLVDCEDEDFFASAENEIEKYEAIFVDEIQDYKPEWIGIIKRYFLAENGELVVFGDEKQNVYQRDLNKDKLPNTGISGRWNKLNESHRLATKIVNLAVDLQAHLFNGKYSTDNIKIMRQGSLFDTTESIEYIYYDPGTQPTVICERIIEEIRKLNSQPNDVAILASTVRFLRELDFIYRRKTCEKTTRMFEGKEERAKLQHELSSEKFERRLRKIRRGLKFNFWANAGTVKFSTIYSFKGWEISTLFLIIEPGDNFDNQVAISEEAIYAGITRCRSNLVIINMGHSKYHRFFETAIGEST